MMIGAYYTQAIYVFARLAIADELRDGGLRARDLATRLDVDARNLERVMRVAATIGLLTETDDERFELTALGQLLREDVPGSVRAFAIYQGEEWHWRADGRLIDGVRTGRSAFDIAHGCGLYEFLDRDPDADAVFGAAMAGFASQSRILATAGYDFSGLDTLVDVGGGEGAVLMALLRANPGLSGVVFDRPQVIEAAVRRIAEAGLAERCKAIGGNFFVEVPPGRDAYMLSMTICDHTDPVASRILANVRSAIRSGGRLLLLEMVVPPPNEPSFATLGDMEVLVTTNGHVRSEAELRELLEGSGFEMTQVIPSLAPLSIIEAKPI
jgi:O-methyltransferase